MGNEVGAFPNDRPVNLPFAPLSAVNKINIRLLTMNANGKRRTPTGEEDWVFIPLRYFPSKELPIIFFNYFMLL